MLHMVEVTHDSATCAAWNDNTAELAKFGMRNMDSIASELGVKVEGGWTFAQGHIFWYVVEAPDAHVVSRLFADTKLFHWNTVQIYPARTWEETAMRFLETHPD